MLSLKSQDIHFRLPATEVEQYEKTTIDVLVNKKFKKPYNADSVAVNAVIYTPSEDTLQLPAFFENQVEGSSHWQLRFTPLETGEYTFQILLFRKNEKISASTKTTFSVKAANFPGFIRLHPSRQDVFLFDNGNLFRGVGENVCWVSGDKDYRYYFKKLNELGCNTSRIWMAPWNFALEWDEHGLGNYDQKAAAELDEVFELAAEYDIYLMLCFDYHGVVQREQGYFNENKWANNPYNAANGGPCKTAGEFFTDSAAKVLYKNRLRYMVARYSHSPYLLAWEFWNEVDLTAGTPEAITAWHQEMAAYLKSIDPHRHLVTTSFANDHHQRIPAYNKTWELADIDFCQTHQYNAINTGKNMARTIRDHRYHYNKPHIIGEYGSSYRGAEETRKVDPEAIAFHNGLWAGLFSPTPVLPLTWWWDNLIDPDSLYFHFKAVASITKELTADTSQVFYLPLRPTLLEDTVNTEKDFTVYPEKPWGQNVDTTFTLGADGLMENEYMTPTYLYGFDSLNVKYRQPPEFLVNYATPGQLQVHINRISKAGILKVHLNDSLIYEAKLPLGAGKGPWKESRWVEQWKRYQGIYDSTFSVDIPAGEHRIRVSNDGGDWLFVDRYVFVNCGTARPIQIETMGITKFGSYYFWFKHSDYTWKKFGEKGMPETVSNAQFKLEKAHPEDYDIAWIDTRTDTLLKKETTTVGEDSVLAFILPPLQSDLAVKVSIMPPFYQRIAFGWRLLAAGLLMGILIWFFGIQRRK